MYLIFNIVTQLYLKTFNRENVMKFVFFWLQLIGKCRTLIIEDMLHKGNKSSRSKWGDG
jgi:hypothetical protein